MAATVTLDNAPDGHGVAGDVYIRRGTVNLGTYATGGIAVDRSDFSFAASLVDLDVRATGGYVFEWSKADGVILAYWVDTSTDGAPLAEVTDTTDLSGVDARFRAEGR